MEDVSDRISDEVSRTVEPYGAATFDEVVVQYAAPLKRFFRRRMSDVQAVENLIQETFLRVFRYARSYRAENRFGSWIYAIAANLYRDWLRTEAHQPHLAEVDRSAECASRDRESNPEAAALDREVDGTLLAVLASIPRRHRDVFVLKHHYGLTYAEVGRVLAISEGTVKSRMFKATRLVVEKMARRGFLRREGGELR